jgi:hypothetical protein
MGLIGCTETSVTEHQSTLRNIPEERRFRLHYGGSLKSPKQQICCLGELENYGCLKLYFPLNCEFRVILCICEIK